MLDPVRHHSLAHVHSTEIGLLVHPDPFVVIAIRFIHLECNAGNRANLGFVFCLPDANNVVMAFLYNSIKEAIVARHVVFWTFVGPTIFTNFLFLDRPDHF